MDPASAKGSDHVADVVRLVVVVSEYGDDGNLDVRQLVHADAYLLRPAAPRQVAGEHQHIGFVVYRGEQLAEGSRILLAAVKVADCRDADNVSVSLRAHQNAPSPVGCGRPRHRWRRDL